jgi:glycerol kinase
MADAAGGAASDGLAIGPCRCRYAISRRWEPEMDDDTRTPGLAGWRRGVDRTLGLAAPEPVGAGAA